MRQKDDKFLTLFNSLNLDQKTRMVSRDLLAEFLESSQQKKQKYPLDILRRISILIAGRSQVLETVGGEKIRGVGINVMQLLKDTRFPFDEFISILKNFVRFVDIEKDVRNDIDNLTRNFFFLHKFFTKYNENFTKMNFSLVGDINMEDQNQYFKYLKEYGWLIFIIMKHEILGEEKYTEIHSSAYLQSYVFYFLVKNGPSNLRSRFLSKKMSNQLN